ncbi:MAG: replication restart helicase PriA [Phycisphaerales bacterium]|jgi:primosomal protein N' (replication factor Y)
MPGLFDSLGGDDSPRAETDAVAGWASVAVEGGMDTFPEGLTYAVPRGLASLGPGQRVEVPFGRGNRRARGIVVARMEELPSGLAAGRVKSILAADDRTPPLSAHLLDLAAWISRYYICPMGVTLDAMLPAAVRRGAGLVTQTMVDLPAEAPTSSGRLGPNQKSVLATVADLPAAKRPIEMGELASLAGVEGTASIRGLIGRGLLIGTQRRSIRGGDGIEAHAMLASGPPPELTEDQHRVVSDLTEVLDKGFSRHLLYGVTGSGKTEVYLRLLERTVAAGRSALLLVPEIALTPQTIGRLLSRFPEVPVSVLHSGLTPAQRHRQWTLAADGTARIVTGARSAIFAPIPDDSLGLVIVDEEHDASYKQDQAPRYHGRDVAIRRAQQAGCPVLLGTATPSLETWHNTTARHLIRLHRLPKRAPGLNLPKVQVVDFGKERRRFNDRRVHLIGPTLGKGLADCIADGGQALLLLNRRGYANYIACSDQRCGWMQTCSECDAGMVCHRPERRDHPGPEFLRCHHCDAEQRVPRTCPECGHGVVVFGLGTQRVEEELRRILPDLGPEAIVRVDSDSMDSPRDLHRVLEALGRGEVRVLLGTQMIAKGLDFPGVRLVGVVNGDTSLSMPDFRASERTFQLINQVAGRCGRGEAAGRAIVQSFQPDAPAIRLAALHRFEAFAQGELEDRVRFDLPPHRRMARLVVRDEDETKAKAAAERLLENLRPGAAAAEVELRGPAPCPIARIAGRHRIQIELLAPSAGAIQTLLQDARRAGHLRPGEGLAVDVDPVALL